MTSVPFPSMPYAQTKGPLLFRVADIHAKTDVRASVTDSYHAQDGSLLFFNEINQPTSGLYSIKRGDPALCIYEKPGPDTITVMRPGSNESSDLAQRVAQLESLVQASLGGQAPVPPHLQVSVSGSSRASDSAVQVAAAALGELSQQQDRMQDIEDASSFTSHPISNLMFA